MRKNREHDQGKTWKKNGIINEVKIREKIKGKFNLVIFEIFES